MRRYVERVEKLASMKFFRSSETLKIMGADDGVVSTGTDNFDEESLMATIGLFRMLYGPSEPTSFSATMKLLSDHVRQDTPRRGEALGALRELRRGHKELLRIADIAMVVERHLPDGRVVQERMATARLIELWLHGYFLHGENAEAAALEEWPIKELPLWEFCGAVRRFARLFWIGRNVVAQVLQCPALAGPASLAS